MHRSDVISDKIFFFIPVTTNSIILNNKETVPVQPPPPQIVPCSNQDLNILQQSPQAQPLKVPPQTNQSYYIPWHSIVPILPANSGPVSPPDSELSPPLSAPPVPNIISSQVPAPVLDIVDDEGDPEPLLAPTEDDDDVFETEPIETPNNMNATDVNNGNKRRSQSLSSLQTSKESAAKVKVDSFMRLNLSMRPIFFSRIRKELGGQ